MTVKLNTLSHGKRPTPELQTSLCKITNLERQSELYALKESQKPHSNMLIVSSLVLPMGYAHILLLTVSQQVSSHFIDRHLELGG